MTKTKQRKTTIVQATFSITLPKTSKRNAAKLMEEALGTIQNYLDNADSLFDSFDEIYGEQIDGSFPGYSYGFLDKITVK